jgi:hypothetical protein
MSAVCHRIPRRTPRTAAAPPRGTHIVLAHSGDSHSAYDHVYLNVSISLFSPPYPLTPAGHGTDVHAPVPREFRSCRADSSRAAILTKTRRSRRAQNPASPAQTDWHASQGASDRSPGWATASPQDTIPVSTGRLGARERYPISRSAPAPVHKRGRRWKAPCGRSARPTGASCRPS